jgi:hypothetical protein
MSQISTSMVSSAVATTAKQSRQPTPQCRWTEPELSIGARCGSMDILGRYKCWHVRDKSPAHLVWEAVSKPIIDLLEDQHEHLNARGCHLRVDMFMIGRKEASSSPTVLFSCESKSPRQKAMEIVRKKGILTAYPEVLLAESSRVPQPLALGNELGPPFYESAVYVNGTIRNCGTSILVSAIDGGPSRKATMGGIVCIDDEYYGLTTAHPFLETSERDTSAKVELDFAFYGQEELDDSSSTEGDFLDMTSMGER